jgi:hypothetical protein
MAEIIFLFISYVPEGIFFCFGTKNAEKYSVNQHLKLKEVKEKR